MAEAIRKLNASQGTTIITRNGEAKAALIDIKVCEDLQETLTVLEMIVQGNKNLTEGRFRPAEQVLKEFEERINYQLAKPNIFVFGIIHGNRNPGEVLRQRMLI